MIYKVEWNKVSVLLYKVAFNCLDTCREWEQTDIWYWIIIAVVSFVNWVDKVKGHQKGTQELMFRADHVLQI